MNERTSTPHERATARSYQVDPEHHYAEGSCCPVERGPCEPRLTLREAVTGERAAPTILGGPAPEGYAEYQDQRDAAIIEDLFRRGRAGAIQRALLDKGYELPDDLRVELYALRAYRDEQEQAQQDKLEKVKREFQAFEREQAAKAKADAIDLGEPPIGEDAQRWEDTGIVWPQDGTAAKAEKLARFDLIPWEAMTEVAENYGAGAKKYTDRNWEKGHAWGLSFTALHRHLVAFWEGEYIDPEQGTSHLAAVVFHALTLIHYAKHYPELDDRPRN